MTEFATSAAAAPIFDIVVPLGPNDVSTIETVLTCAKKNIIGYRNIYLVVSPEAAATAPACVADLAIIVDESEFPFSKKYVESFFEINKPRAGWYLQQLIKLYAGLVIPDILNNYLVIDADTFFLKPTEFFYEGKPLYNVSDQFHIPYFTHSEKLHPSLDKNTEYSGICHHMMFQTHLIKELFQLVETRAGAGVAATFADIFLYHLKDELCGASEYEIYFQFLNTYHPADIIIRKLRWENGNRARLEYYKTCDEFDYVSCHFYINY